MVYVASVVLAVLLALLAIQIIGIVAGYQKSTGTPWQRFLATFSHSQTILLARLASFLAGFSVWAVNFLPAIDPTSTLGMEVAKLLPPQYSTYYALVFALLVEFVRRRPSSIDPVIVPPQAVEIPLPPAVDVVQ